MAVKISVRKSESPVREFYKAFLYGVIVGIIILIVNLLSWTANWQDAWGYILAGIGITAFGRGAERLWDSTIGLMVRNPYRWYALLTRIPFWWMAGGIGYTIIFLIMKKLGLISKYDIPIKAIFSVGCNVGIITQAILQFGIYRANKKDIAQKTLR